MKIDYFELVAITCTVLLCAGASLSLLRGVLAMRAKTRLKEMLAGQLSNNVELRILSEHIAKHSLNATEIESALRQMQANVALLSNTDRGLLEPGLSQNTPQGTMRFVKEVLARAS